MYGKSWLKFLKRKIKSTFMKKDHFEEGGWEVTMKQIKNKKNVFDEIKSRPY